MAAGDLHIVTGSFSFTGRYITRRLLALDEQVKTLTDHPHRDHPFGKAVTAVSFHFDDPRALVASLEGAATLFNTYWIRLEHGEATFDRTVANTRTLLEAAREAGVRHIVHLSSVGADENSPFPYFRAKGQAERAVRESGLSFTIVRPTLMFGNESIFFNNIAWMLHKFPVFAIPGGGDCRLQPVYVDDVAELAINAAHGKKPSVIEAAGPEVFSFEELIRLMARRVGSHIRILHVRPERVLQLTRIIGGIVEDIILTGDEIEGLRQNLLLGSGPPAGHTLFSRWLLQHAKALGVRYRSELAYHFQ
jgi:uncharacterized protein YbjT (DUF2867 family)